MVKLLREYRCAPDGHTVVVYPAGSEVSGQVAKWAIADGAAREVKVSEKRETKKRARN